MARKGNVIKFPGAFQRAETNNNFSEIIRGVRSNIRLQVDSDDVITDPLADGFLPHVYPNGAVVLANEGLTTYKNTFENIELNDRRLDWAKLYFVQTAYYQGIKERIKNPSDKFHDGITRIARYAIDKNRISHTQTGNDIHDTEDILIGWFAAVQAKIAVLSPWVDVLDKEKVAKKIFSAAEKSEDSVHDTYKFKKERSRLLGSFTLQILNGAEFDTTIKRLLSETADQT